MTRVFPLLRIIFTEDAVSVDTYIVGFPLRQHERWEQDTPRSVIIWSTHTMASRLQGRWLAEHLGQNVTSWRYLDD